MNTGPRDVVSVETVEGRRMRDGRQRRKRWKWIDEADEIVGCGRKI